MLRVTRRRLLGTVTVASATGLSGCILGGGSGTSVPEVLPFGDRLSLDVSGGVPFSNPWHYKEVVTEGDTLEGFDTPVWVVVCADNARFDERPPEGKPAKNFEVDGTSIEPIEGEEPADDLFFALKGTESAGATLKFVDRLAAAAPNVLFDGEVLFDTGGAEPGSTYELPPP